MKQLFFIIVFFSITYAKSQAVGIGTQTPDTTAVLHLQSTSKGFLPPRLTQQQINSISNPTNGLLLYNTNSNSYQYFNSPLNQWVGLNTNVPLQDTTQNDYLSVTASTTEAFGFSVNANDVGTYSSTTVSGTSVALKATKSAIIVRTNNNAAAFFKNGSGNGTWLNEIIPNDSYTVLAGNHVAVIFSSTNAYAFYKTAAGDGSWVPVSIGPSSFVSGAIAPNDLITVRTFIGTHTFYINKLGQGQWVTKTFSNQSNQQIFSN